MYLVLHDTPTGYRLTKHKVLVKVVDKDGIRELSGSGLGNAAEDSAVYRGKEGVRTQQQFPNM